MKPFSLIKVKKLLDGFTLVELLIVVAIIGVLSTIGIPTFKRMVQKSKKSEAKVNLGGVYTAEQAFFSEYGCYGDNLHSIGFDAEPSSMNYLIGFPTTASCTGSATAQPPAAGNTAGTHLNSVFPAYYTNTHAANSRDGKGPLIGYNYTAGCTTALGTGFASVTGGYAGPAIGVFNNTGTADAFIATASGVISPSVNKAAPAATEMDTWAIDSKRRLVNGIDGTK